MGLGSSGSVEDAASEGIGWDQGRPKTLFTDEKPLGSSPEDFDWNQGRPNTFDFSRVKWPEPDEGSAGLIELKDGVGGRGDSDG